MVNVHQHVDSSDEAFQPRLNVLLTRDRSCSGEHWTEQLPRLLEPQGVWSRIVSTGQEAIEAAEQVDFHAAVIDMATPVTSSGAPGRAALDTSGGIWILELFRRMPNAPAAVVVQNRTHSQRQLAQILHTTLRLGAFSVVNKPVTIEQLLDVFRRVLERHYQGVWPAPGRGRGREPGDRS